MCVIFEDTQPYACIISQGKAVPIQAWTGPEGSRRVRLPDFKTRHTKMVRLSA